MRLLLWPFIVSRCHFVLVILMSFYFFMFDVLYRAEIQDHGFFYAHSLFPSYILRKLYASREAPGLQMENLDPITSIGIG